MIEAQLPAGVPDRLYGRRRGHPLRARQQRLLEVTLPRLRLSADAAAADPRAAFPGPVEEVWLEVGFGGGEHALAQIADHPRAGLIACEVFENGLCSLLSRLVPEGGEDTAPLPGNLLLWDADARRLLAMLPEASLDRLFLLFPDPWPKARHAKRRFVHPALLPVVARVLKPGAEWRIATRRPDLPGLGAGGLLRFGGVRASAARDGTADGLAADALRGQGPARGPAAALLDRATSLSGAEGESIFFSATPS